MMPNDMGFMNGNVYGNMNNMRCGMNGQSNVNTNMPYVNGGQIALNAIGLPRNTMWCFWEQGKPYFYVKTVDANGISSVETYKYSQVINGIEENDMGVRPVPTQQQGDVYVTNEKFTQFSDDIAQQLKQLQKSLNDFKSKIGNANKKETKK